MRTLIMIVVWLAGFSFSCGSKSNKFSELGFKYVSTADTSEGCRKVLLLFDGTKYYEETGKRHRAKVYSRLYSDSNKTISTSTIELFMLMHSFNKSDSSQYELIQYGEICIPIDDKNKVDLTVIFKTPDLYSCNENGDCGISHSTNLCGTSRKSGSSKKPDNLLEDIGANLELFQKESEYSSWMILELDRYKRNLQTCKKQKNAGCNKIETKVDSIISKFQDRKEMQRLFKKSITAD